jgi:hypothetical protein
MKGLGRVPSWSLVFFPLALPPQVLACLAFTSMCVTALLLGRRPNETQGRILAGMVAAVCMVPCRVLLPKLYKSANAPLPAPAPMPTKDALSRIGAQGQRGRSLSVRLRTDASTHLLRTRVCLCELGRQLPLCLLVGQVLVFELGLLSRSLATCVLSRLGLLEACLWMANAHPLSPMYPHSRPPSPTCACVQTLVACRWRPCRPCGVSRAPTVRPWRPPPSPPWHQSCPPRGPPPPRPAPSPCGCRPPSTLLAPCTLDLVQRPPTPASGPQVPRVPPPGPSGFSSS